MNTHGHSTHTTRHLAGFSLIYVILVILALGTLGAGLVSLTNTGSHSQLEQNAIQQARLIALAGFNYIRQFKEDYTDLEGLTFTLPGSAGSFEILEVTPRINPSKVLDVRVRGTVNQGQWNEANYVIDDSFMGEEQPAITFRDDFDDFHEFGSDRDAVVKDEPNRRFTIGNNLNFRFGAMYYRGTKYLGDNTCDTGVCDFGSGFRMFFVSNYISNTADGIVFTWFNAKLVPDFPVRSKGNPGATNNMYEDPTSYTFTNPYVTPIYTTHPYTSIGGSSELGEMIGYAGDGRVYDNCRYTYCCASPCSCPSGSNCGAILGWVDPEQDGIQPPKMGVEFDNYPNTGTGNICSSTTAQPAVGQRYDHSTDHIGYVFWGAESPGTTLRCPYYLNNTSTLYSDGTYSATIAGGNTFDDNRHGAGFNTSRDNLWLTTFSWQNNPFAFRMEVERKSDRTYVLNSWIRRCSDTNLTDGPCREYFDRSYQYANNTPRDKLYYSDTSRFLCGGGNEGTGKCTTNNPPILSQTVTLTATQHDLFEAMIFGFTAATGGATQYATFSEFVLQFIKSNDYDALGHKRRVIDKVIN